MLDEFESEVSRSPADYWAVVYRRRWWILLPLFLVWLAVWGISWFLPSAYQSEALILVEQQKVPDQYVVANVSVDLQDRLQTMTQQILSRTRLQATIDRFHLYPPSHGLDRLLNSDDPVEEMRKQIKIDLVASPGHPEDLSAFKIQFTAESPTLAQQVNTELTSLFIEENLKAQQELSENTTAFLENQLAAARAKMEEQEAKVAAFKASHLGNLPSQLESNVQILSGMQTQMESTQQSLNSAKQQKLYLESLLQQYESLEGGVGTDDAPVSPQALDKELLDLQVRMTDLRSHYTDDHPDIISLKDQIAKTEKLKKQLEDEEDESAAQQESSKTDADSKSAEQGRTDSSNPSVMQARSQLKVVQLGIQDDQDRQKELESQLSAYERRLNLTPETEQELAEISRGYEESEANYNSLLQKQMQSQLATSLEQRQQGQQFSVIDPPSVPTKPSAPNHFLVSLGGLGAGIALGIGLAVLLELTDVRIRLEKDLEGLVPARVLVGIPLLSTTGEDRRRSHAKWLELGAAVVGAILIVGGNLYAFYKG